MSKKIRIHSVVSLLTGVCACVAGLCLILACIGIWGSGEFTRDGVASAFTPIAIPVYLSLLLVLAGWVLHAFWPVPERKFLRKLPMMALHRARAKADLQQSDPALVQAIRAQQQAAQRWNFFAGAVCALCAVAFLSYALNPSHYSTEDVTGSVRQAVIVLLPCLAAAIAGALAASVFVTRAAEKETALLKNAAKKTSETLPAAKAVPPALIQGALLAIAAAMVVYGVISGGTTDVLAKAVNICTECVGLG